MKFEFLNEKWAKTPDSKTLINRFHVTSFEYDEYLLEIYVGIRCIRLRVDRDQYDRFKNFVLSGCTL